MHVIDICLCIHVECKSGDCKHVQILAGTDGSQMQLQNKSDFPLVTTHRKHPQKSLLMRRKRTLVNLFK